MAFGWGKDKAELPPEIKDKTPEQVVAELAAAQADRTRLTSLETENSTLKTTSTTQATELAQVKASLAMLEGRNRQEQQRQQEPPRNQEPTSVMIDENAAFSERLNPLVNATMVNAARLAKLSAESQIAINPRDSFLFRKYRGEYDSLIQQLSLQQQTIEAAYLNCFKLVKADHINDMLDASSKGQDFFSEPAGAPPPNQQVVKDELTDEEKKMAKRFGVSDADYLKSKKQMQLVGV